MSTLQDVIDEKELLKKRLQPTPPIGFRVLWFEGNNRKNPRPADVTGIEGSGKLELRVVGYHETRRGVCHVSSPVHEKVGSRESRDFGSWDFVPYTVDKKTIAEMTKRHEDELDRTIERLMADQEKQEKASAVTA